MTCARRRAMVVGAVIACVGLVVRIAPAQQASESRSVEISTPAATLESIPTVSIDSTEGTTTRRVLDTAEAAENRPRQSNASGAFTYLSSEPGKYIRFTRLHDKIAYVEHVDLGLGRVTWWGELRIVAGARPRP